MSRLVRTDAGLVYVDSDELPPPRALPGSELETYQAMVRDAKDYLRATRGKAEAPKQ
jgi:hypothetical protein